MLLGSANFGKSKEVTLMAPSNCGTWYYGPKNKLSHVDSYVQICFSYELFQQHKTKNAKDSLIRISMIRAPEENYLIATATGDQTILNVNCNVCHFTLMTTQSRLQQTVVSRPDLHQAIIGALDNAKTRDACMAYHS